MIALDGTPNKSGLAFFLAIPLLQSIESRDIYYYSTIMLVSLAFVFMAHLGRPVGKLGANAILGVSMAAAKAAAQARGAMSWGSKTTSSSVGCMAFLGIRTNKNPNSWGHDSDVLLDVFVLRSATLSAFC